MLYCDFSNKINQTLLEAEDAKIERSSKHLQFSLKIQLCQDMIKKNLPENFLEKELQISFKDEL